MKYLVFLLVVVLPLSFADLEYGFYEYECPQAEHIIHSIVRKHFATNPYIAAAILRMHFHDCFVRGCDASILIDSTARVRSEKAAFPNLTLREFEIIDEIKVAVEEECPEIVSCADIIALATRDAVALAGGPDYEVPTGRRDGLVSLEEEVNLPAPQISVAQAAQAFADKGFTLDEMVTLLGAHSIGVTHCLSFKERLFNFRDTLLADPSMNEYLLVKLKTVCATQASSLDKDPTVFLDQNTSFLMDNQYYNQILQHRGILQIDQELGFDPSTAGTVSLFAYDGNGFMEKFADAVVKMGTVGVLVENEGEIRKNCRVFNTKH